MIGIVIVSHSARMAQGVVEIVEQMVQGRVPLATAGGTDIAEAPIGTDPFKVHAAIDSVYSEEGVLVLMDLGSALMSAEAALDMLTTERKTARGAVRGAAGRRRGGGGCTRDDRRLSAGSAGRRPRAAYASKTAQLTSLLHLPATETWRSRRRRRRQRSRCRGHPVRRCC